MLIDAESCRDAASTLEQLAAVCAPAWTGDELLRAVVTASPLALYVVDPNGLVQLWNPACERLFGWTAAETIGRRLPFVQANSQEDFDRLRMQVIAGHSFTDVERTRVHRDGHEIELSISTVPLHDNAGSVRAVLGVSQDITARKTAEAALVREAHFDSLTGLLSRGRFFELLDAELAQPRCRAAVVYLDLDNFKDVNDSYGHAVGDKKLAVFAARLQSLVREQDLVARMGGDEFAVLLRHVGPATVRAAVQRIFHGLESTAAVSGPHRAIRATGGAALCHLGTSSQQVLREADVAMYEAKRGQRGGFFVFDQRMHDVIIQRVELEAELSRAMGDGQFVLDYQPTFRLAGHRLSGFEALVRWQHPDLGLLQPDRFIELAESTGAIIDIGNWVLRTACAQLRAWHKQFPAAADLVMSVNLSQRQLGDPSLCSTVSNTLRRNGIEPSLLQLEVTETALAADGAESALMGLRDIGVHLAIDDFGTGYSSLTSLRRYPFDTLKVDRSFVCGIAESVEDKAIVHATLSLARALGLHTVAEGIETETQRQLLVDLGCDDAQGFLLGRPQSPASIAALIHRHTDAVIPCGAVSNI